MAQSVPLLVPRKREPTPGCWEGFKPNDDLYFVRSERGPVKIGRSKNVRARFKTLRCASADELSLIGIVPGAGWLEPAWHYALSLYHIRGEWFEWSPELRAAIRLAVDGHDWTTALDEDDVHDAEMMISQLVYRSAPEWFDRP